MIQTKLILFFAAIAASAAAAEQGGDSFKQAVWNLAEAGKGSGSPLTSTGAIELGITAQGEGSRTGEKTARLTDAYFDAGPKLNVKGDQVTVFVRARDPRGQWTYALVNKRGSHDIANFNLFSVDLPGTPGPEIGFELHSEAGFAMINFPVSRINSTAWHDLVGRYDGKTIELICDGRVMARQAWRGGNLTQNDVPLLIGAEVENGQIVRPFTGEMQVAAVWARALKDDELAKLMHVEKIICDEGCMPSFKSPVQYRPDVGRLADTIPFFWKGEYHIFYLHGNIGKVPWEHIVSTDLVHWKELPTALVSDGAPDGPDGEHMFTGSVAENHGTFHIFYTGWNPRNPQGREFIMHATSPDLIKWTKHPTDGFRADDITYRNVDFRDPYVFRPEPSAPFWMILCASDAKTGRPIQGVAQSDDLVKWKQIALAFHPPLGGGPPECPDVFRIGDTWYLIHSPSGGTTDTRYASDIRGPYRLPKTTNIDTLILYAAKRMYDGKRHVLTGWLRDLAPEQDDGGHQWGGTQSIPREVYAGKDGQLFFRPVSEVTAVFNRTVVDLASKPSLLLSRSTWAYGDSDLAGEGMGGSTQCALEVPPNYMLQCRLRLDPKAVLSLVFREQSETGFGYRLILHPETQEAEIAGENFRYPRRIELDASKSITIQAFVQGTTIECFINDAYAFSSRAYKYSKGRLGLNVVGGKVKLEELTIKLPE